jgi:HNH endonuclease
MNLPDSLPILSKFKQLAGSGKVCAEQIRSHGRLGRFVWASDESRFLAKIRPGTHQEDCWGWLGGSTADGYGNIEAFGQVRAHRASWVRSNGPIPDGLAVLHRCDNPPCVNPLHLFLGTIRENNQDRNRKGRDVKAFPTRQKVTVEMVQKARQMRASGMIQQEIADELGISRGRIAHYIGDVLPRGTRGVRNAVA